MVWAIKLASNSKVESSADKLSLEEATSGVSVVGNNIVFETPPTNGQTVSIVNV